MRCRVGDLAVIVTAGLMQGRLVEVLYAAPMTIHVLPDGVPHQPAAGPDRWVVKSLGQPFSTDAYGNRQPSTSRYGQLADRHLRPLRPGEGEDEILRRVGRPEPEPVAWG